MYVPWDPTNGDCSKANTTPEYPHIQTLLREDVLLRGSYDGGTASSNWYNIGDSSEFVDFLRCCLQLHRNA